MSSLRRIVRSALRLPSRERVHAVRAVGWLALSHVAVIALPYSTIRALVDRVPHRWFQQQPMSSRECRVALARASRIIPSSRCLARGVAAECLLRREGQRATLEFGISFDERQTLHAHAWVESDGIDVTGGEHAAASVPLVRPPRP